MFIEFREKKTETKRERNIGEGETSIGCLPYMP